MPVERLRLTHGMSTVEMHEGFNLGVPFRDPLETGLGQLHGLDRAARDLIARLERGQIGRIAAPCRHA
jgi:hypothetical protein